MFEVSLTYFPANIDCAVEKVLHMDQKKNIEIELIKKIEELLQRFNSIEDIVFAKRLDKVEKIERDLKKEQSVFTDIDALLKRMNKMNDRITTIESFLESKKTPTLNEKTEAVELKEDTVEISETIKKFLNKGNN